MYLERIFDIFINLAVCGQIQVRMQLCSAPVMTTLATTVANLIRSESPLRYPIAKLLVKLVIALTVVQHNPASAQNTRKHSEKMSLAALIQKQNI